MEYRQGNWYIERYCYDDGMREYFNEGEDKFFLPRSLGTAYATRYLAKAVAVRFVNDNHYSYNIQFCDL